MVRAGVIPCGALLAVVIAVHLTETLAEPILFPDNPEFPSYKDRTTTSTRPPIVVRDPRRQKNRGRFGQDPSRKNRFLNAPSGRSAAPARTGRNFRYDQRELPSRGRTSRPVQLVGLLPRRGRNDLRGQGSRRITTTLTTQDGVPIITNNGADVARSCPKPTGKFPVMRQCDKYLDCVFNIGYLRQCPPGTKYNYKSTLCDFPYRVECVDDFEVYQGAIDQVGAASTLPPLTPSVMERPTARLNADGSVSSECPLPAGMFAVPGRCNQFLNCWNSRGYVQRCAPGTLFNCHTEKCDFPHKVRCVNKDMPQPPMVDISEFARTGGVAPRSRFGAVMSPPSGQRLRIRGGRSSAQGHVQLYHEGQWNNICENSFSRHMADTVCWDLGFTRGSEELSMKTSLRFKLTQNTRLLSLQCVGDEMHVHECQKRAQDKCKVMGIKCQKNTLSSCPPGYRLFQDSCYKVFPSSPKSREEAMSTCETDGGDLLALESQEESDFVSEMLQYLPDIGCIHTGGVGVSLRRGRQIWMWEATLERIQFQRWWPGWNRQSEGEAPNIGGSNKCLILQNVFPSPPLSTRRSSRTRNEISRNMDSSYFWWTAGDCLEKLAFVCEVPQANIECIKRMGTDYRGEAAATETGQTCLHWNDPAISEITKQLNINTNLIGDHNYCRNPDGDDRPWCFVSSRDYDFCDIPRCEAAKETVREVEVALRTSVQEENSCGANMFQCRPGECKFFSWVCDGEEDCSNGRDETECHDYLSDYKVTSRVKLVGYDVEKWLFQDRTTCARRCSETKDFICRAFNYVEVEETCYLLDSNIALSGAVEPDADFEVYELVSEIPDCNNKYICTGGKCINRTQICDGRRDCPGNDDEQRCHARIDFDIRLADGNSTNEGRIEVKARGSWGVVCDDLFSEVDGDVFCRHLGYPLGAAEVVTNAGFGSGNGRFLMDDITCRGDEERVTDCDFAGWGKSDCTEAEVAGVVCREAGQPCTDSQWRCRSGKCVDLTYVCDTVDDCGDFSDEEDALCKLPLRARLVGGNGNSSGRVELRYKGVWGTACDDDFDVEDAKVICRMLGFEGAAIVHKTSEFGPGRGQIWLDQINCQGNEKSIDECFHLPWGQSNCAHEEDVGIECMAGSNAFQASSPRTQPERPPQAFLPERCGRRIVPDTPIVPVDQNPKIVNGKVTQPGSHPWMVGVRIKAGAETAHWCGAVIVSEYHIISAAHCLLDYPQQVYVLRVGDYDNQVDDPEEQEFTIQRMYPHPDFNKGTYLNNDIIIIRVKPVGGRGIRFGSQVQPVCLSPASVPYEPGKKCTIAGWGSTGRRAGYARRLQSVSLPLLPISTCTAPHVYGDRKITDGMYCAGYLEGGIDTCQGDSGGPMVCEHEGLNILYGVTSWGQGCARPNKPGVYTKLTSYLTWIFRTIEEDSRR